MPKSELTKELMEKIGQLLKERANFTREMQIRMDTVSQNVSKSDTPNLKWTTKLASNIYEHLTDTYELLDAIVGDIFEGEKERSRLNKRLRKVSKIVKKPVFTHIEEFMDDFEKSEEKKSVKKKKGDLYVS